MSSRLLTRVFIKYEGGEYGPDYALVELDEGRDVSILRAAAGATVELASRFCHAGGDVSSGALKVTGWCLGELPLRVTWLRYSALADGDGHEPYWLGEVLEDGYTRVPEDWHPDESGVYTAVDLQTVIIHPDGTLEVEANVDSVASEFISGGVPIRGLFGDTIEAGDTVYVTDPTDPEESFEAEVSEIVLTGQTDWCSPILYVIDGRYGRHYYDPSYVQLIAKAEDCRA